TERTSTSSSASLPGLEFQCASVGETELLHVHHHTLAVNLHDGHVTDPLTGSQVKRIPRDRGRGPVRRDLDATGAEHGDAGGRLVGVHDADEAQLLESRTARVRRVEPRERVASRERRVLEDLAL